MSKSQARRRRAAQVRQSYGTQLGSQVAFVQNMVLDLQWAFQYHMAGMAARTNAAPEKSHQSSAPVDVLQEALRVALCTFAEKMEAVLQSLDKRICDIEGGAVGAALPDVSIQMDITEVAIPEAAGLQSLDASKQMDVAETAVPAAAGLQREHASKQMAFPSVTAPAAGGLQSQDGGNGCACARSVELGSPIEGVSPMAEPEEFGGPSLNPEGARSPRCVVTGVGPSRDGSGIGVAGGAEFEDVKRGREQLSAETKDLNRACRNS